MLVAAYSLPFKEFSFQILGSYLIHFLFFIHRLDNSTCLVVPNISDYPVTVICVCDVTNSAVRNFKSWYIS